MYVGSEEHHSSNTEKIQNSHTSFRPFSYIGSKLWNELPRYIKENITLE